VAENSYDLETGADDSSRQQHRRVFLMHEDPKQPLIRRADWEIGDEPLRQQLQALHGRAMPRRRGRPPKSEKI
jgi:hypothetical protein